MLPNLNKCKVLIADDSKLVTSTITSILNQLGMDDISYAHNPQQIIELCNPTQFDLILCDYNFHASLNGFQILEELQYARLLPAHTTFIFLSGEDNPKVIRSIQDSDADDYFFKPLNFKNFRNRILTAMERRAALLPISKNLLELNYNGAAQASDTLLSLYPEYAIYIKRYCALALVKSKQLVSDRKAYQELLDTYGFDWIKIALANTLIKSNKLKEAKEVLNTVNDKSENPYYHDEMSKIAVEKDDFTTAIKHLKQSIALVDAGAERELVITNLSLANESYDDAVTYIRRYEEKNAHTFRDEIYTKLNFTRCYLYRALNNPLSNCFESLLSGLNPIISDIHSHPQFKTHALLLSAHIALIRGDLKSATSGVKQALKTNELTHFYDLYHLCLLLERCSLLDEMESVLPLAHSAISDLQHPSIRRSQIHMLKKLKKRLLEAQLRVDSIRKQLSEKKSTATLGMTSHFDHYFKLHDLFPHSEKICLAIVKLASLRPFAYHGEYRILNKLNECDQVVTTAYSREELITMSYAAMYQSAKDNIRLNS
ncbi:response regulator [Vibrio natriegens]|uniref:response regulator n=1 Tax=Vibrio natriegens TaxID=691 RepID=UPI001593743F|nr:response regulator [Vibrio natriegens]NVC95562.1 response regulator [Vibrio natriegens]